MFVSNPGFCRNSTGKTWYRAGGTGMAGVAAATPIFLLFRPNIFTFLNFPSRTEVHRFIHVEIAH